MDERLFKQINVCHFSLGQCSYKMVLLFGTTQSLKNVKFKEYVYNQISYAWKGKQVKFLSEKIRGAKIKWSRFGILAPKCCKSNFRQHFFKRVFSTGGQSSVRRRQHLQIRSRGRREPIPRPRQRCPDWHRCAQVSSQRSDMVKK